MSPVDRIKLETELQNKRVYSPDEAKRNIAEALTGAAYSTPLAIPLGLRDAMEGKWKAQEQRAAGDEEGARKTEASAIASTGGAFFPGARGIAGDIEGAGSRVGVFVGPMSKTANYATLRQAKQFADRNFSDAEIGARTGWRLGRDGQWKYEISDNAAQLGDLDSATTLGEALIHPALFDAHPQMRDFRFTKGTRPGMASYGNEKIVLGPKEPGLDLENMLHEVQHGIQDIEGFARGANYDFPSDAGKQWAEAIIKKNYGELPYERTSKMLDQVHELKKAGDTEAADNLRAEWWRALAEISAKQKQTGIQPNPAGLAYTRSAGEVEARNVAARAHLTPAERQMTPPSITEEVPPSDQFVEFYKPKTKAAASQVFIPPADEAKTEMARLMMQNLPKNYSRPDKANRAIFDQTGLVLGPEGAAKQWVPDSGMKVIGGKPAAGQETELGNFIDHPALFNAMPELAKTPVSFMPAKPYGSDSRYYTPVARTGGAGGYEISEHMKPEQMRQELAKLMSYSVAEKSGFSAAGRHALGENVSKIDDTIAAVNKGVESGDIPGETGVPYMERLQKVRGKIDAAKTAATTDAAKSPWLKELGRSGPLEASEARKALSIALNSRMAGNIDAKIAKQRVATGETDYPYSGPSMTESVVLPQRTDDMQELARFLANWKNYGQAARPPR